MTETQRFRTGPRLAEKVVPSQTDTDNKAAAVSFRAWFGVALAGGPIKRLPDEHGADFCGVPVEDRGARVRVWVR